MTTCVRPLLLPDAAAFTFCPTKVLGAYGDGGAVVTADERVERTLRRLRYYGMEERIAAGYGTPGKGGPFAADVPLAPA